MAETKIRLDRQGGFTVLPNGMLRDSRLNPKTKGIFAIMCSFSEGWEYSVSGLSVVCGVGRDAIRSALKELEKAGYLEREQSHGERGRFGGNVYILHEVSRCPDVQPLPGFPSTVEPSTGEPSAGEPLTENPTQYNKDLIKERLNKDYIVQSEDVSNLDTPEKDKPKPAQLPKHKPERFQGFWDYYPRHVKRDRAVAAWDKLKPDDELIGTMGRALARQVAYWNAVGKELQFIPHAASWINQQRWNDPPEEYQLSGRTEQPSGGWADSKEVL